MLETLNLSDSYEARICIKTLWIKQIYSKTSWSFYIDPTHNIKIPSCTSYLDILSKTDTLILHDYHGFERERFG